MKLTAAEGPRTRITHCWLGATPSRRTIMVRPTWPVREHSRLSGRSFFLHVMLEWRCVISASSFSPLKVASSRVRWILATPNTIRRVLSPVTTSIKAKNNKNVDARPVFLSLAILNGNAILLTEFTWFVKRQGCRAGRQTFLYVFESPHLKSFGAFPTLHTIHYIRSD